ncbi:MAG TPA: DMT family transporter [Steroidobacteraceae bacterium]|jgi:drug/metabolite transporter (DMT)-like permease|nr:DMT family transporter [Steroidobacteraceae bacterium]
MPHTQRRPEVAALIALLAGALATGSSGIFVRLSETGPTATAFWRGALALPLLAIWAGLERRTQASDSAGVRASLRQPLLLWAGVFFAGDLALWHTSLLLTSVAASSLEANCAPMLVSVFAWVLWGERPRLAFLAALALAFGGMLLILAPKLGAGGHALIGDALGLGTACFYAAYILAVARLRGRYGTGIVMLASTLVFSVLLLPLGLLERFLPGTATGWWVLIGLAVTAQVFGQGMIAYALAHLPATFGAVGLFVQVVAAAVFAWAFLGERLAPVQIAGGAVVLGAIALARRSRAAPRADIAHAQRASIQSSAARQSDSR